jgi:hypothetical protein
MFKFFSLLSVLLFSFSVASQSDTVSMGDENLIIKVKDTSYWTNTAIFGLNGTQSSFVNWSAGGRNNISVLGFIDASAVYQRRDLKWNNELKLALGGLKFVDNTGLEQGLQKTDDRIDLSSSFGYEFKKKWFYTGIGGFKTQFLDGFVFPNDSVRTSTFMAPGYTNFALGIEYAPSSIFNMFLSPIASKITIVNDQVLANAGAFGVEKAQLNSLGEVIVAGKRVRSEVGSYFRLRFQKEIFKNIEMRTRLELFSNYLNNPQNIDVNLENIFTFKVNKWFSASLQWNLVYDDDIDVRDNNGGFGPRTQFKSVLSLGLSHTIKNQ